MQSPYEPSTCAYEYVLSPSCNQRTIRLWVPVDPEAVNHVTNETRDNLTRQIETFLQGQKPSFWAVNDLIIARTICHTFSGSTCEVGSLVTFSRSIYYAAWP